MIKLAASVHVGSFRFVQFSGIPFSHIKMAFAHSRRGCRSRPRAANPLSIRCQGIRSPLTVRVVNSKVDGHLAPHCYLRAVRELAFFWHRGSWRCGNPTHWRSAPQTEPSAEVPVS
jgi:hypothetical protein